MVARPCERWERRFAQDKQTLARLLCEHRIIAEHDLDKHTDLLCGASIGEDADRLAHGVAARIIEEATRDIEVELAR